MVFKKVLIAFHFIYFDERKITEQFFIEVNKNYVQTWTESEHLKMNFLQHAGDFFRIENCGQFFGAYLH